MLVYLWSNLCHQHQKVFSVNYRQWVSISPHPYPNPLSSKSNLLLIWQPQHFILLKNKIIAIKSCLTHIILALFFKAVNKHRSGSCAHTLLCIKKKCLQSKQSKAKKQLVSYKLEITNQQNDQVLHWLKNVQ